MRRHLLLLAALLLAHAPHVAGFNGHRVVNGPLVLTIEPLPTVRSHDQPQTVNVTLESKAEALQVRLDLTGLVDSCQAIGPTRQTVAVPAKGQATATFRVRFAEGCYSALYPVHVRATFEIDGKPLTAHAIAVVSTAFPDPAPSAASRVIVVPRRGAVALAAAKSQVIHWSYLGQANHTLPAGWHGRVDESFASFDQQKVSRGELRAALHMHPPYRPRAGTISAEYTLRLPDDRPLRLNFFTAIRDTSASEPPSDGVTFRVWGNDRKLFERHSAARVWTPGEVDLTPFAGQEIRLRLESHPGPKGDTTCDSSFWGDPVVSAGPAPRTLTPEQAAGLLARTRRAAAGEAMAGDDLFVFPLADGSRAALGLGAAGLFDGVLAFGSGERQVCLGGLRAAVLDHPAGRWPSPLRTDGVSVSRGRDDRLVLTHRLRLGDDAFDLTVTARAEGAGLRLHVSCPRRITDLSMGAADRTAERVYFGHGYCIHEPGAFRVSAGGHGLSTAHVAFDFADGPSLLVASDTPPEYLHVDPAARLYALHTHPDATFTFVPGSRGGLDCALRYRPLDSRKPAPAFARMAGRFVFDIWGGRYTENAALLRRALAYGMSDSLYVLHVWQRWGYDYRLPDIFPPDPKLGSLEDVQALARLCAEHKVPFAPHDNYIDFYPDADDYSYDHITFDANGRPRRAWFNRGRQAQSYQFRPDHILPFVQRNLKPIAEQMRPTAYFVDVFASMPPFDYHDRKGAFHSRTETLRHWAGSFDHIRTALGGDAPMISEAGGDYMVGRIEGSDCQFLRLSDKPGHFVLPIPCKEWQRVPWMDLVHHDRYSLHGVGYSDRYQGGTTRAEHGIESDDYLSAELLTGHALMIDRPAMLRGGVRKYWLAQDIARAVAGDHILSVAFAEGDLHRQVVNWRSGARVWVNRGSTDWKVEGRVLPPFGYLARAGLAESCVERLGSAVVERSRRRGSVYVNGRGGDTDFGELATRGGVRCQIEAERLTLTPLPDSEALRVRLRPDRLLGRAATVVAAEAVDETGKVLRPITFTAAGGQVELTIPRGDFGCRLRLR